MTRRKLKSLFDSEYQKLPPNVHFLKVNKKLKDEFLYVSIAQNNSLKYYPQDFNKIISPLIQLRNEARENKDWALSDKIRDELLALGIQLKDGKEGTSFSLN